MAGGRRRRKKEPENMGEAILQALEGSGLTDQARRVRISRAWKDAVGATLAKRTAPEAFSRGTLIVRTASAAWQNELTFLKARLIQQINDSLGQELVRDIKVVSGRVRGPAGPKDPELITKRPLSTRDQEAVADASLAIKDPDVRAAFERALARVAQHSTDD